MAKKAASSREKSLMNSFPESITIDLDKHLVAEAMIPDYQDGEYFARYELTKIFKLEKTTSLKQVK